MGAVSVTKINEPDRGRSFYFMVDLDKQFGGSRRTPFSPQVKPIFLPGQVLSPWDPIMSGLCWCAVEGTPGQHRGPQIGHSDFLSQIGRFPRVGVGQVSLLRLDLEGDRLSFPSDLQLLKVPGPTHAFLQTASLPSDWQE